MKVKLFSYDIAIEIIIARWDNDQGCTPCWDRACLIIFLCAHEKKKDIITRISVAGLPHEKRASGDGAAGQLGNFFVS